MGLEPDDVLNPDMPWLPPADGRKVQRAVQRCGCGEVGCGSLTVTMQRVGDTVEWTDARDGRRRYNVGPFRFDATAYEDELRRADRDRAWERREQRIARLVTHGMWDWLGGRPRSFDWASGTWAASEVVVSMTDHRANPRAGQEIGPRVDSPGGWWVGIEPEEHTDQYVARFSVDAGESDDVIVDRIVEVLRTTEPSAWPLHDW
jgi:hypothetical protein